jgi:hypothetical protein
MFEAEPGLSLTAWRMAISAPAYRLCVIDLLTAAAALQLRLPIWGGARYVPGAPRPPPPPPPSGLLEKTPLGKLLKSTAPVRQVLRCEPAEIVIALGAFGDAALTAGDDTARLQSWCERSGLSYDALVSLVELRDAMCASVLNLGLDPFWGAEHSLVYGGGRPLERVARFRSALADAWRERVLIWDPKVGVYRLAGTSASSGTLAPDPAMPVVTTAGAFTPRDWGGKPPRFVAAGGLSLKPRKAPGGRDQIHQYDILGTNLSAIDGVPDDVLYGFAEVASAKSRQPATSIGAFRVLVDGIGRG